MHRHDAVAHDALLCVQTGTTIDDPKRFKFDGEEHYLKSADEMRYLFGELPEACDNTLWIAERANVEIEFGKPQLPEFPHPRGLHADDVEYLRTPHVRRRRAALGHASPPTIAERLAFELQVIAEMGFTSYFLIVWDLIRHAREQGIRVGPGPGQRGRLRGRRTACASPTSTRSSTTCCSSGS